MRYKGLYIEIIPDDNIIRSDSSGNDVVCRGFSFSVFSDETRAERLDSFSAAVGYEILENSIEEAEQFAKDVVACEDKVLGMEQPNLIMGGA